MVESVSGAAGLQRADKEGKLDGPGIKAALESLKDWYPFDTKNALGVGPYTITDKDHRPTPVASLYTIKDGKIVLFEKINMKEQFPDKWAKAGSDGKLVIEERLCAPLIATCSE